MGESCVVNSLELLYASKPKYYRGRNPITPQAEVASFVLRKCEHTDLYSSSASLRSPSAVRAQSNVGELRLKVIDPSALGVKSSIELACDANQFHQTYSTDSSGAATAKRLAFGLYVIDVQQPGLCVISRRGGSTLRDP